MLTRLNATDEPGVPRSGDSVGSAMCWAIQSAKKARRGPLVVDYISSEGPRELRLELKPYRDTFGKHPLFEVRHVMGSVALLRWAMENGAKECFPNRERIVRSPRLHPYIKWAWEHGAPLDERCYYPAAFRGYLETL